MPESDHGSAHCGDCAEARKLLIELAVDAAVRVGPSPAGVVRAERLGVGSSRVAGSEIILQERWKRTGHVPRQATCGSPCSVTQPRSLPRKSVWTNISESCLAVAQGEGPTSPA